MLASSQLARTTQRRNHKRKHKGMERFPFSCACACTCLCLRRCVVRVNRDDANIQHKRKERKLKNSGKLSAYILVTHALPFAKWRQEQLPIERLEEAVRNYSVLYEKGSPEFQDNNNKSLAWEDVAVAVSVSNSEFPCVSSSCSLPALPAKGIIKQAGRKGVYLFNNPQINFCHHQHHHHHLYLP